MNTEKMRCKDISANTNNTLQDHPDCLQQAKELIQSNNTDAAIKELEKHLKNDLKDKSSIYCQLGVAHLINNEFAQAENNFMLAVNENPNCTEGYFNLGLLYQNQGFYHKALPLYKEAVLLNEDDAEIYELMGDCCKALKNYKDAKIFYDASIRINPNALQVAINLTQLYLYDNEIEKARDVLKIALISHPDKKELYYALGEIHKSQNEYENAIGNFRKVISLDESDARAYYELGYSCYKIGLTAQAIPLLSKAYKLDPLISDSLLYLGKSYEKKKNTESAVSMYREWIGVEEINLPVKNIQFKKEFVEKCLYLANYYSAKGKLDQSEIYYKKMSLAKSEIRETNNVASVSTDDKLVSSLVIED